MSPSLARLSVTLSRADSVIGFRYARHCAAASSSNGMAERTLACRPPLPAARPSHQDAAMIATNFPLRTIGHVRSSLKSRAEAPRQGNEGAPRASIELDPALREGLSGIQVGHELILLTWFHEARRDVLKLHPRNDASLPLTGVFATRSPDRPNPIGLHRVRVLAVGPSSLDVEPLEAIDGTPIIDIKPVLVVADD
jgi:tRNA-Thr(GGU) m(6)t(6)A37 methyltransferase TsaA